MRGIIPRCWYVSGSPGCCCTGKKMLAVIS
jgi:hypothetical protein